MISVQRLKDGNIQVVQIKREFMNEFAGLFQTEAEGLCDKGEIQEELNNVYSFASGMLTDLVSKKAYKTEVISKEEFDKRFKSGDKDKEKQGGP